MVAYTSPDCLPYFEGGDSPCVNTGTLCEPSTVGCDFATIAEAKLDEFDGVVEITSVVPMAWIETFASIRLPVETTNQTPVTFDTVRVDTANMVNLDVNPHGVTITRSGLYNIFLYCRAATDLVGANITDLAVTTTALPPLVNHPLSVNGVACDQSIAIDNVQIVPSVNTVTYYEEGQSIAMTLTIFGNSGDALITMKIAMGVTWMGDLL